MFLKENYFKELVRQIDEWDNKNVPEMSGAQQAKVNAIYDKYGYDTKYDGPDSIARWLHDSDLYDRQLAEMLDELQTIKPDLLDESKKPLKESLAHEVAQLERQIWDKGGDIEKQWDAIASKYLDDNGLQYWSEVDPFDLKELKYQASQLLGVSTS